MENKVREKFNRRLMADVQRIKFFAQHRYRANWPFLDGHVSADAKAAHRVL